METTPDRSEKRLPTPLVCERCGKELTPGTGNLYFITIEAIADPAPQILAAQDPSQLRDSIEQLLAATGELSEQEALDQVYRRITFYLCGPCYRQWIQRPTG